MVVLKSEQQRDDLFLFEEVVRYRLATLSSHKRFYIGAVLSTSVLCLLFARLAYSYSSLVCAAIALIAAYALYAFVAVGAFTKHIAHPATFLTRANRALHRFHIAFDTSSRRLIELS
eukprot:ANDGO_06914.mRNA.1 hypothetical protein